MNFKVFLTTLYLFFVLLYGVLLFYKKAPFAGFGIIIAYFLFLFSVVFFNGLLDALLRFAELNNYYKIILTYNDFKINFGKYFGRVLSSFLIFLMFVTFKKDTWFLAQSVLMKLAFVVITCSSVIFWIFCDTIVFGFLKKQILEEGQGV